MSERPRVDIPAELRRWMQYRKFSGAVPRMFILESNYWLDGACKNAAQRLGWELASAPVVLEGAMPPQMVAELLKSLALFRPDFILSINISGMDDAGLFAQLFADLEIPSAAWFVDEPRTILMDRNIYASDYAVALSWESSYCGYLRERGFAEAHTMPLAVDTTIFNAPPGDAWPYPPSFVGNSMTGFAAREWAWVEEHPAVASALREAFESGRVTRERFAEGIESMLGGVVRDFDPDERRHAELVCFIEGTRRLRHALVSSLAGENICAVGDEAWRDIAPLWSPEVHYTGTLPGFYRQCEVNLNSTSIQMATAANQRVFDCPSAGGFLLTDAQASLFELFDADTELAVYHTLDEARELLRFYRSHPKARVEVTRRAQARILGAHTYEHRLRQLEQIMRARYGE